MRSLLLAVLAITLIPVFLIGFSQAYARLANDREVVRRNLVDGVALSAEQALNVIASSEQALINLTIRDDVRNSEPTCAQSLAIAQLAMPSTTNLARINAAGFVTCSARAILMSPNLSKRAWLPDLSTADEISYAGPAREGVSGIPVLIVGVGLKGANNAKIGHIVAGINLEKLEIMLQERRGPSGAVLTLVDHNGVPVHRDAKGQAQQNRKSIALVSKRLPPGSVTSTRDGTGRLWTYARATLVPDRLFIVYAMPDSLLYSSTIRHVATDIALPLIALLLAGAGLWYGIQLWAIKPIVALRSLAKQYAVGRFNAEPPNIMSGPMEMNELRDEMVSMADRAAMRDVRLKRVADQKETLVKELHHRVKNNLQVIISLISIQARHVDTPEQKAPLEQIHARITAMALVQRLVVETDDSPVISVSVLLDELCALIRRTYVADSLRVQLRSDCDATQIPTDMATPLILFAFEAITNAFRHGFKDQKPGQINVQFCAQSDGQGTLEISDTGTGWSETDQHRGTGHKLLVAFARQLGGKLTLDSTSTSGTRVSVTFNTKLCDTQSADTTIV